VELALRSLEQIKSAFNPKSSYDSSENLMIAGNGSGLMVAGNGSGLMIAGNGSGLLIGG